MASCTLICGPSARRPRIDRAPTRWGRVNFSLGTCVQDHEFHAQSRRGLLRIRYLGLKARTRWIGKEVTGDSFYRKINMRARALNARRES